VSLSDIPGKVALPRAVPVGLLVVAIVGGTVFWWDTRAQQVQMGKRLDKLELSEERNRDVMQEMKADIRVIRALLEGREPSQQPRRRPGD
jgi:nitrogen fixation-related uncharacterized protein